MSKVMQPYSELPEWYKKDLERKFSRYTTEQIRELASDLYRGGALPEMDISELEHWKDRVIVRTLREYLYELRRRKEQPNQQDRAEA